MKQTLSDLISIFDFIFDLKMIEWSYAMAKNNRPLVGWTVGQVMQNSAERYGDAELLVSCHQGIIKTFTQLNKETSRFAAGLLSLGFRPGDRIGIWTLNCYEWAITFFAAAKAGLILVNINPSYCSAELKYCLNKVQVKGIVCPSQVKDYNYYAILAEIAPELLSTKPSTSLSIKEVPSLGYVIIMDDKQLQGTFKFENIFKAGRCVDNELLEELKTEIQFDDAFGIMFTSGTTGKPKAVVTSHFTVVNNARFSGARIGLEKNYERVALCGPLYHVPGSIMGLLANVIYGSTTILPCPSFDAPAILKSITENRVTSCYGTPTMFVDLISEYKKDPFEIIHLHAGIMTGAPCPERLVTAVMTDLKMKDFIIAFGMTETVATFHSFPCDSPKLRTTTIGCLLDNTEAKVVNEDGKIVSTGVPGELYIRGYSTFLGYWEDEEKTRELVQNGGWIRTGDFVTMDENKYVKVVGRLSDMIIRGGENIYPAEIENFFLKHDNIIEAQIFGVPDKRWGQEAAMWVKSLDINLTEEEIQKWANGKISQFKIPKYILIKNKFPTTIVGKVNKKEMREETVRELQINSN